MIKKNRKGVALLIVMILSALILLIVGLFVTLAQAGYKSQALNISGNKALSIAEKGINDLINPPFGPPDFTSFTANTDPVLYNNYSYYWAKEVIDPNISLIMHGEAPNYFVRVNYYKFNVYVIGVISKTDISGLSLENLKTLTEDGEIIINNKKITVDSERIIHLTMFEKDNLNGAGNPDGTISFVPNTAMPKDFGSSYYPFPYRSDWQEIDLATFKNPPGS